MGEWRCFLDKGMPPKIWNSGGLDGEVVVMRISLALCASSWAFWVHRYEEGM